mmetsp:Transcript_75377/g.163055  ORF Transcript_75377/g.163055 Transcript_75377/m.163055 type:complete len:93 (+) Transcript_75377:352-630(+)
MFWVVRAFKSSSESPNFKSGFKLKVGDLIKLGRIKFFIRELSFNSHKAVSDSNDLFFKEKENTILAQDVSVQGDEEMVGSQACRVCLCDSFT